MLKQKKAQYYIISVILLLSLVYLMIPRQSVIENTKETSKHLYNNFESEIPYFANYAFLHNDETIVNQFVNKFIDFSKEKRVFFNVVYVFTTKENIWVYSTSLNSTIESGRDIQTSIPYNQSIMLNSTEFIEGVTFINITIDNKRYPFTIKYPSFKAILVSQRQKRKDVFIYE